MARPLYRDQNLTILPGWKDMPLSWLSCPPHGSLISHPQNPDIALLPMKTPMPESFSTVLGEFQWTIPDVLAYISTALDDLSSFRIVAINVSSSNQVITSRDWEAVDVKYVRIPVKRSYPKTALDQFTEVCNTEAASGRVLFLVYSGKGLTRVSFCIVGYLAGSVSLASAISGLNLKFYKSQPLAVLCETLFPGEQVEPEEKPGFLQMEDSKIAIGQIPLSLEKFKGVKKIARKEITGDEVGHVLSFLPPVWQQHTMWNSTSMDEIRRGKYLCSFEPRALKAYLVATSEKSVFLVDSRNKVWLLRAHAPRCRTPLVAYCYFIEEQRRSVALLCDLYRYGEKITEVSSLEERLSVLAHSVCTKVQFDGGSPHELEIYYRPMAKLRNVIRLKHDLMSFFTRSEAIVFYSDHESITLPLDGTIVLQFEYNGAGKAVLLASAGAQNEELVPVAIFNMRNAKYIGLNRRTSRFEYNVQRSEWQPVTLGHDDLPSTVRQVQDLLAFLHGDWNVDTILDTISKLKP
jgi:hypothetical protein